MPQFQSPSPSTPSFAFANKTHADTPYSLQLTDGVISWTLTNASNDVITLPAASTAGGYRFTVKLCNTTAAFNTLTINRAGSDTIVLADGTGSQTSLVLFTSGEIYDFQSDGVATWHVCAHRTNTEISITYTGDGFGTIANGVFYSTRTGALLSVVGSGFAGTVAATTAAIVLPTGLTIATADLSAQVNLQHVGDFFMTDTGGSIALPNVNAGLWPIFYDGSTNNKVFIARKENDTNYQLTKVAANNFFNNGSGFTFRFAVPILGWKT